MWTVPCLSVVCGLRKYARFRATYLWNPHQKLRARLRTLAKPHTWNPLKYLEVLTLHKANTKLVTKRQKGKTFAWWGPAQSEVLATKRPSLVTVGGGMPGLKRSRVLLEKNEECLMSNTQFWSMKQCKLNMILFWFICSPKRSEEIRHSWCQYQRSTATNLKGIPAPSYMILPKKNHS